MRLLPFFILLANFGFAQAQTTVADWQKEAARKYPDLAREGSELSKKFNAAMSRALEARPALFADPKWPMILADELNPAPPAKTMVITDPLLIGKKRIAAVSASPVEAALKKLEQAVQTRNVAQITAACDDFTSPEAIYRAQAKTLGKALADASRQVAEAEQFSKQSVADVARLRRNATLASIPNSLSPNDPIKARRAAELSASADALEKKAETNLATAKQAFENGLRGLEILVQKVRDAEAEKPAAADK